MKPWFIKEDNVIPFPKKDTGVVKLPNVNAYPDFLSGVQDLQNHLKRGDISSDIHKKLYQDLIHRFMRTESFETPWFLREGPEEEAIKQRTLSALQKRQAEDPIFDKIYKEIVGPQLGARIEKYIGAHKDADIGAEEMSFLIKEIPALGPTQEVKSFVGSWNGGADFIDINKLVPDTGMTAPAPLESVVANGIPKALFQKLTKVNFRKSDAGPAEAALAIMSNKISYSTQGGDLIVGNKKIEVKSGGKGLQDTGRVSRGGRVWGTKKVDQSVITQSLTNTKYQTIKSFTIKQALKPLPADFPKDKFLQACSTAWFGKMIPSLKSSFGTANFYTEWMKAIYDDYKVQAGHTGILVIGVNAYQYIINGEQLAPLTTNATTYLYYPGSTQTRELAPQITIK